MAKSMTHYGNRVSRAAVSALHEALENSGRVVFLAALHCDAREAFRAAAHAAEGDPRVSRVGKANGAEYIETLTGSELQFFAASATGERPVTADILFVAEHLTHGYQGAEILAAFVGKSRIITF